MLQNAKIYIRLVVLNTLMCLLQYELLDEIMDFGYPQFTEAKILTEYIKTDAYRMEVTQKPPMAVTNAVSWRSEGIVYKKNEVSLNLYALNWSFRNCKC